MPLGMYVFVYAFGLGALVGALLFFRSNHILPGLLCAFFAFAAAAAAAWMGWDFSPSFTMLFLAINLSLYGISGLLAERFAVKGFLLVLQRLLFSVGTVFVFPAVYIYTAGDDFQRGCVLGAVIAGSILSLGAVLLQGKKQTVSFLAAAEIWLHGLAAAFTLFGGFSSVALLPYGIGLWLVWAGRQSTNRYRRLVLIWIGIAAASLFAVLPAIC